MRNSQEFRKRKRKFRAPSYWTTLMRLQIQGREMVDINIEDTILNLEDFEDFIVDQIPKYLELQDKRFLTLLDEIDNLVVYGER